MVDSVSGAYGAGYGYTPYSSSGRQTTSITVETDEEIFTAQVNDGGKKETLSYRSYSQSVTIDINSGKAGLSDTASAQLQEGQQALATVQQTAAEASDFLKNDAKQKLQIALNELKLLKLLGQTPAGAKEAARLAKQIADAASEYASGGGAAPAGSADASAATSNAQDTTDGTASTDSTASSSAAASTATATKAASDTATGTAASTTTADAAAGTAQSTSSGDLTPAEQDPFFQEVQAALKELKKYLQKTLPALEASSDEKIRKLAKRVEKSFNESVAQIASAEAQFNTESTLGSAGDTAALGGTDSAASAAASIIAGAYQPVNISV